jgi:glycosyltransferase involved in cell wall biosynthesis
MNRHVEISAIVPVIKLVDKSGRLIRQYLEVLEQTGRPFELVYVLDGEHEDLLQQLLAAARSEPRMRIIQLAKNFGEASALTAGFENTNGETVLTLPAYAQVKSEAIPAVLDALRYCDVAIATRAPNKAAMSHFKSARRKAFHWLMRVATGQTFSDIGCGVRALKRHVVDELPLYGDQYRFIPLLAARRGFNVREVIVSEVDRDQIYDRHGISAYLARLLDVFAIVFLTRFTKKPLRFFGTIGSILFAVGAVFLVYLAVQRLFFDVALADRPALLLTSLMVVLGMQVFALGLLGELIIFTHAKDMKEYSIDKIVN